MPVCMYVWMGCLICVCRWSARRLPRVRRTSWASSSSTRHPSTATGASRPPRRRRNTTDYPRSPLHCTHQPTHHPPLPASIAPHDITSHRLSTYCIAEKAGAPGRWAGRCRGLIKCGSDGRLSCFYVSVVARLVWRGQHTSALPVAASMPACLPALWCFVATNLAAVVVVLAPPLRACERIVESTHVLTWGADAVRPLWQRGGRCWWMGRAVQPWWCGAVTCDAFLPCRSVRVVCV